MTYPHTPGHKGRHTGIAAAEAIEPKVGTLKARVLAYVKDHGPVTPEEIARATGIFDQTCRARCSELAAVGLLEDSGETGVARGGRRAIKWRVPLPAKDVGYDDSGQYRLL